MMEIYIDICYHFCFLLLFCEKVKYLNLFAILTVLGPPSIVSSMINYSVLGSGGADELLICSCVQARTINTGPSQHCSSL